MAANSSTRMGFGIRLIFDRFGTRINPEVGKKTLKRQQQQQIPFPWFDPSFSSGVRWSGGPAEVKGILQGIERKEKEKEETRQDPF